MASVRRRRRSSPHLPMAIGAVVLLLLVTGLAWYFLRSGPEPDASPTAPPAVAEPDTFPIAAPVPPLELPELDRSDAFVRELVTRLSQHPQLAAWLVPDELIHRFVRVVVDLAGHSNPAENVAHLRPGQAFSVVERNGRLFPAAESYRRYDLLAATFASLDPEGTVVLYRQLYPLIDEAYRELGIPDITFDEMLERAIYNLLAAEVPDSAPEVVPHEAVYEYADPGLEGRRGAEKALMRMGPQNAQIVQETLATLQVHLELRR